MTRPAVNCFSFCDHLSSSLQRDLTRNKEFKVAMSAAVKGVVARAAVFAISRAKSAETPDTDKVIAHNALTARDDVPLSARFTWREGREMGALRTARL
jgi:hypothetical protein